MNQPLIAIISTKRPGNVAFMNKFCAPFIPMWFVNDGEGKFYAAAGAKTVIECGDNICSARNYALRMAFDQGLPCVQISDDLRNIKRVSLLAGGKRASIFITVEDTVNELINNLKKHNAFFGGVAINNNPLNYTGEDISTDKLIVNDFIAMIPSTWRFDEHLALKEDYDMCIQQLIAGNKIIRCNNILCDFPHRQNEGGANTYRNEATEDNATQKLMRKWPKYIMPHRTRPGQVSLNYTAIKKRLSGTEPTSLFDNL